MAVTVAQKAEIVQTYQRAAADTGCLTPRRLIATQQA